MGTHEAIIYRVVMMLIFTTRTPYFLGLQNPTKNLAYWLEHFGQPLSRNNVFEIFRPVPPSKVKLHERISMACGETGS